MAETEIKTYLRYFDIYGTRSKRSDFEEALKTFDLSSVLRFFAGLNAVFSQQNSHDQHSLQNQFANYLFEPDVIQKIGKLNNDVFHRHQFLFVIREAIRLCPDLFDIQPTIEMRRQLGKICLMANDHLSSAPRRGPIDVENLLDLMLDFIPIGEMNQLQYPVHSIARLHKMVQDLAPSHSDKPYYFDIPAHFEAATKLPLQIFEALFLSILPRVIFGPQDLASNPNNFGISNKFFEQTPIKSFHHNAFFELVSATPDQFRKEMLDKSPLLSDFTVIRNKPFAQTKDRLIPLDMPMCIEKFENAVFWSIFTPLSDKRKIEFSSFWGRLFEDYVCWLLTNSVNMELNYFCPMPHYADGQEEEVCDGIVICGTTAVFIECKGGLVRGDCKYSNDSTKLGEHLESKYVAPQGVCQLAKAIDSAFSLSGRRLIRGINLDHVQVVMPLLVTRDNIGGEFFVNDYLDRKFSDLRGAMHSISQVYCSKLFSISVDTLEKLSPFFIDTRFAEILSERYINDPPLRAPFFLRENSALSRKGMNRVPELLKKITEEVRDLTAKVLEVDMPSVENS